RAATRTLVRMLELPRAGEGDDLAEGPRPGRDACGELEPGLHGGRPGDAQERPGFRAVERAARRPAGVRRHGPLVAGAGRPGRVFRAPSGGDALRRMPRAGWERAADRYRLRRRPGLARRQLPAAADSA